MDDYGSILEKAKQAAVGAAAVRNATLPPEQARGFDCGFAWVIVRPAEGKNTRTDPFMRYCKGAGEGERLDWGRAYGKGWLFWSPAHAPTQSISVHEAGARAFANVLREAGIVALVGR